MLDPKETLTQKFVKKWFWLYFFTILIGPIGYIVKMMISRDLSVEEVGVIYGIISFIMLISSYNDLGVTESLNYFLPKYIVAKEYGKAKYLFLLALKTQIVTSIFIVSILFFLRWWLSDHYFGTDVRDTLSVALLFLLGINIFHSGIILFSVSQDTKLSKSAEFIRLGGTAIGTATLFFTDAGNVFAYMTAWIGGLFVGCIFSVFFAYRKYYKPYFLSVKADGSNSLLKGFFRYSLATLITANIGTVLSQIDMQLIINFLDQKSVGYYSNYLSLIGLPFMIIGPIIGFIFPVISELTGRKDDKKIQTIVQEFSMYFMIISLWMSIFFIQFGEEMSVILFGEKFRMSGVILAYSAPFIFFNFMTQIAFQVLAWIGKIKERAKIFFITLMINVPLTLVLIHTPLSVKWAALAVGMSWIPLWFLSTRALEKYKPKLHLAPALRNAWAALLTFGICIVWKKYTHISEVSFFFVAIFVYMSIFLITNRSTLLEIKNVIARVRAPKISQTSHSEEF